MKWPRCGPVIIFSLTGWLLTGCGSGGSTQTPPPAPISEPPQNKDLTAPRIVTRSPAADEQGVAPDGAIKIAFDEPINASNLADQIRLTLSDEAVPAKIDCDSPCLQVTLTPQSPLLHDASYRVIVERVADLAGNAVSAPISWSFTIAPAPPLPPPADTTPPRLKSVSPQDGATGVDEGTLITLTFDEEIDPKQLEGALKLTVDGEAAPLAGTYGCSGVSCTFAPAVQLRLDTTYRIEVSATITDLAGNPLAEAYTGRFITRANLPPPDLPWSKEMGNRFNQHLFGADAVSTDGAWAVGEQGLIVSTSDAGAHWTLQESGTLLTLYGVHFINAQVGFAVGGQPAGTNKFTNVFVKTTTGGAAWEGKNVPPPLPGVLKAVRFIDPFRGWVVGGGGTILFTDNAGESWTVQQSGVTSELITVDFVDGDHGWATGPGKVLLKTDDGGKGWRPIFTFSSAIRQIDFINPSRGWAAGDGGALLETTDGGAHWTSISVTTANLTGVRVTSDLKGWAVGERGSLLRFDGTNWTAARSATTLSLRAVATNGDTAWSVGDYGVIASASTSGAPALQNQTNTAELYAPLFIDAQTGWVVGTDGRIFRTDNGGATWTQQLKNWKSEILWTHVETPVRLCNGTPNANGGTDWTETPVLTNGKYQCVRFSKIQLFNNFFLNSNEGWVIGLPSLILHTTDGGKNWTEQNVDPFADCPYDRGPGCLQAPIYLRRIQFVDPNHGWAVGRFRTIFKTSDGGKNWRSVEPKWPYTTLDGSCTTPSGTKLTQMGGHLFGLSVNPADPNDVFVAGGCCVPCNPEALIARTRDGGATWELKTSVVHDARTENQITDPTKLLPEIGRFHTFQMLGDNGWAAGRGGVLMRTEDRGATWKLVPTGTNLALNDLFFIDPMRGWIAGWTGTFLKTEDGGKSWQRLSAGTRNDLFGVYFLDARRGWIAGSGDLVLSNGGD